MVAIVSTSKYHFSFVDITTHAKKHHKILCLLTFIVYLLFSFKIAIYKIICCKQISKKPTDNRNYKMLVYNFLPCAVFNVILLRLWQVNDKNKKEKILNNQMFLKKEKWVLPFP